MIHVESRYVPPLECTNPRQHQRRISADKPRNHGISSPDRRGPGERSTRRASSDTEAITSTSTTRCITKKWNKTELPLAPTSCHVGFRLPGTTAVFPMALPSTNTWSCPQIPSKACVIIVALATNFKFTRQNHYSMKQERSAYSAARALQ